MILVGLLGVGIGACVLAAADEKPAGETVLIKVEDLVLQVPQSWKKTPPANRLRLAQYEIPAAEGDPTAGELVVSNFGVGGGGAVQENVDRWVNQFQAEGRMAKRFAGTCPQGKYVAVDVSGTYKQPIGPPIQGRTKDVPGSRMIAIMLQTEKFGAYFLKLVGPQKTIAGCPEQMRGLIGAKLADEKEEPTSGKKAE